VAASSSTSTEPGCSRRFPSSRAWSSDSARACPSFNVGRYVAAAHSRSYDVSRDGKRFLFLRQHTLSSTPDLTVVINWIEELKARMRQK